MGHSVLTIFQTLKNITMWYKINKIATEWRQIKIIKLRSEAILIEYFHIQLQKNDRITINAFNYIFKFSFQQYLMQNYYIVVNLKHPITAVYDVGIGPISCRDCGFDRCFSCEMLYIVVSSGQHLGLSFSTHFTNIFLLTIFPLENFYSWKTA